MAVSNLQAVPGGGPSSRQVTEINQNPQGLTRRVAVHILETFFRRPWLYLIPLVLLLAAGVYTAMGAKDQFRSVGVLHASSGSLLSELTGNQPSFGYERPSTVTSRRINDLVGTSSFLDDIIARAGLTEEVDSGVISENDIRSSIVAQPQGDNLVAITATTEFPEQSKVLADATLAAFVYYIVDNDILDATVRIETYERLRADDLANYEAARKELDDFLAANPWTGDPALRPIDQQLEVARLQESVARADEIYRASDQNVDGAQLAADVAETVVSRQLRIVDQPGLPTLPLAGVRAATMTIGMFFVLGLILSAALLVLAAVMDRTVRTADDVESKFGLDTVAVLPSARR